MLDNLRKAGVTSTSHLGLHSWRTGPHVMHTGDVLYLCTLAGRQAALPVPMVQTRAPLSMCNASPSAGAWQSTQPAPVTDPSGRPVWTSRLDL